MRSKKQIKKLLEGQCYFCKEKQYDLLDVHRIVPGAEGGRYYDSNTIVLCCLCHRLCHSGNIKIDRWYPTTRGGVKILHYWIDGKEYWN